jgi:hypothetical protein
VHQVVNFPDHDKSDSRLRQCQRHRCRNPRCATKLSKAVDNPRNAFCCSGCFTSYFRGCCLVCERRYNRKAEHQWFCRPKCKKEFYRHPEQFLGRWGDVSIAGRTSRENPIKRPGFRPTKAGREFVQIVGPALSPAALRLASLPLDLETAARVRGANAAVWIDQTPLPGTEYSQVTEIGHADYRIHRKRVLVEGGAS